MSLSGSTMGLWSRNRLASRSTGMNVIWEEKKRRAFRGGGGGGLRWASRGPSALVSGKIAGVFLQLGFWSFLSMVGCLAWKWVFRGKSVRD